MLCPDTLPVPKRAEAADSPHRLIPLVGHWGQLWEEESCSTLEPKSESPDHATHDAPHLREELDPFDHGPGVLAGALKPLRAASAHAGGKAQFGEAGRTRCQNGGATLGICNAPLIPAGLPVFSLLCQWLPGITHHPPNTPQVCLQVPLDTTAVPQGQV